MVPADGSIVVSFIGYETKHVSVVGMTNVNVTLKEASEIIDEIVVVGYGSGKKISSVIGQVDQVKSDKIENRPSNNVADALQGQVAGLQIMTGSGEVNQTSSIRIHGIGSINAGTSPLILLDGAPISSSTLLALNQNDIASINVLKCQWCNLRYDQNGSSQPGRGCRGDSACPVCNDQRNRSAYYADEQRGVHQLSCGIGCC